MHLLLNCLARIRNGEKNVGSEYQMAIGLRIPSRRRVRRAVALHARPVRVSTSGKVRPCHRSILLGRCSLRYTPRPSRRPQSKALDPPSPVGDSLPLGTLGAARLVQIPISRASSITSSVKIAALQNASKKDSSSLLSSAPSITRLPRSSRSSANASRPLPPAWQ